jgi:HAD superfamily hydrolase (TIGR01490 family)
MERRIRPIIQARAVELIGSHVDAERVIITATNSFITLPIATELGITNLIATDVEVVGGRFTGRHLGIPSFREGKVHRLKQWLAERGERLEDRESWFYSDSLNDLPLLEMVDHPVAVDPDPTLQAHALERGWPVISLK